MFLQDIAVLKVLLCMSFEEFCRVAFPVQYEREDLAYLETKWQSWRKDLATTLCEFDEEIQNNLLTHARIKNANATYRQNTPCTCDSCRCSRASK